MHRFLLPVLLLVGCATPVTNVDPREAWFRAGQAIDRAAVALDLQAAQRPLAPGPQADIADLAFLDPLVGNATVVGLGEAAHGSHSLFQLQSRVAQYLILKHGFTVVAFEANWPETLAFPDYLEQGKEPVQTAVEHLGYRMWKTQEATELLSWMRLTNQNNPLVQALAVTGFDVQNPEQSALRVLSFYDEVAPTEAAAVREAYACFPLEAPASYEASAACEAALLEVHTRLAEQEEALAQRSSPERVREVIRHAWLVHQAARLWGDTAYATFNARRDEAMADQLRWLAEAVYPGRKIVVWGHQLHTGVHAPELGGPLSMGHHLRRRLGAGYVSLGFTFDRGIIQAAGANTPLGATPQFAPTAVADAERGSLESFLSAAGAGPFGLDVRNTPAESALGRMLRTPLPMRAIGIDYDPARPRLGFGRAIAATAFDALVFVQQSTPTQLLENAGPRP